MAVDMILNSLSLLTPVDERGTARQLMSDLIAVLSTAKSVGVKTLRTQDNLYYLMLSLNYPIASWLQDNQVDRTERSFFRTLATKTPLLKDISNVTIKEEKSLAEFKYQGESANDLGIAYLLDALVVSFNSESKWNCDSLDLEIIRLEEEINKESGTEELILRTSTKILMHASKREHVSKHKPKIHAQIIAEPWHPFDELLPCYVTADGISPIAKWLGSLDDQQAQEFIKARFSQVKQGTLGDWKPVGEGVRELRIFYGPGYRIYFAQGTTQSILLCGGDKSSQPQNIKQAQQHWKDYKQRTLG